ncbi:Asparaginyl-tRNA synthetase, cytoplasmic [Verticillium dahliae VDG1]|nr:Asparaginyl-tRNA synthetase, cytoplasmic [Verticillium dahliae VDG1]
MDTLSHSSCTTAATEASSFDAPQAQPSQAILDFFFPGFSILTSACQKYFGIDLNVYIPLIILCGGATFAWQYLSDYVWGLIESHLMSSVDVRTDDEIYNILMAWVATQRFAKKSRRFIANTNLNSRAWFLMRWSYDEDEEDDDEDDSTATTTSEVGHKKKGLAYTPSFGNHIFWYKGRLLRFKRSQNQQQGSYLTVSEREEISISCFGRSPWILKQLLLEARLEYLKKDTKKTMIYRGGIRAGSTDPTWQRCMARTSRPFSTVILNEKTKKELIDDVSDYLSPATRNWYSNRGIPWRRGYLYEGPPGCGKSSLALALAGYFKLRIYIVSLSSIVANEETLATLFSDLPRRCVVLLEDIDTAGLTHTREVSDVLSGDADRSDASANAMVPGQLTTGILSAAATSSSSRLSLSGLLNILDGVASQEGRVLIMTTNHVEKLDKALIRPGRVDMIVKFSQADADIIGAIFRAIYAPLEGDDGDGHEAADRDAPGVDADAEKAAAEAAAARMAKTVAHVEALSHEFVARIPAHEFSPAEIQGFLMRHKRSPDAAIEHAAQWVIDTRKQKKEKEIKAAEERRAEEEKEKEKEKETTSDGKEAASEKTKTARAEHLQGPGSDSGYATSVES